MGGRRRRIARSFVTVSLPLSVMYSWPGSLPATTTAFWWLAVGGIALLLFAAGTLVVLNYSAQVTAPLLSAFVIGILTFTVTFVSSLKGSAEETTFTTSVVEDMRSHLPAFINPDPALSAISVRASDLSGIARGLFAVPAGDVGPAPQAAIGDPDVTTFNLELLQYVIVRHLRDRQRVQWGVAQVATPEGPVSRASVNQSPGLSNPVRLQGQAVLAPLAPNRFATTPYERFQWENIALTLPKGASLALKADPGGEGRGPQTAAVIVQRPGYFTITITVTPIGSTGPGVLPEGLHAPPADRPHYRTHHYIISANAQFSRLTAGNWRTEENKAWARWAFQELEARFRDSSPTL